MQKVVIKNRLNFSTRLLSSISFAKMNSKRSKFDFLSWVKYPVESCDIKSVYNYSDITGNGWIVLEGFDTVESAYLVRYHSCLWWPFHANSTYSDLRLINHSSTINGCPLYHMYPTSTVIILFCRPEKRPRHFTMGSPEEELVILRRPKRSKYI